MDKEMTEEKMQIAMESVKLFNKRKFREAFKLHLQAFGDFQTKAVLVQFKESYIESRHRHNVAGGFWDDRHHCQPWCDCGWEGPDFHTGEEARAFPCPHKMALVKNLRIKHLYHDNGHKLSDLKKWGRLEKESK